MKTMHSFIFFVLMGFCSVTYAFDNDGNSLYTYMKSSDDEEQIFALGFIVGVSNLLQALNYHCPPDNSTRRQVYDTVKKYLRDHPEERNQYADLLVTKALLGNWACKK